MAYEKKKIFILGCIYSLLVIIGTLSGVAYARHSVGTSLSGPELSVLTEPRVPRFEQKYDSGTTKIMIVGDVMMGRSVMGTIRNKNDFTWPFVNVAERLRSADITYANLETPIVADCPDSDSGFKFCADPRSVEGLQYAGIDIVSLANNHTTNYGRDGLDATKKYLENGNIAYTGVGDVHVIEHGGTRYAFLAFNNTGKLAGIDNGDKENIAQLQEKATTQSDIQIVLFHWGTEYVSQATKKQIELAHYAIERGVDVVVGAHPHWVQNNEMYMGKPIYYSLGNFVFDQDWSEETKHGLAIELTFNNGELQDISELPVYIENNGQPVWATN